MSEDCTDPKVKLGHVTKMDPVTKAEKEINFILANLESETGTLVESIRINSLDITNMDSYRQILRRSIRIELRPAPGSNWDIY